MGKEFVLCESSINNMISLYETSASEVSEALKQYQLEVDGVLGTGWKGKAAEKFTAIIEEYERTTQQFILQIQKYKIVMQLCGSSHIKLTDEGRRLSEHDSNK